GLVPEANAGRLRDPGEADPGRLPSFGGDRARARRGWSGRALRTVAAGAKRKERRAKRKEPGAPEHKPPALCPLPFAPEVEAAGLLRLACLHVNLSQRGFDRSGVRVSRQGLEVVRLREGEGGPVGAPESVEPAQLKVQADVVRPGAQSVQEHLLRFGRPVQLQ